MRALCTLAGLWLAANLLHAAWLLPRYWLWRHWLRRGAGGLAPDAEPRLTGNGATALLFIHGFADTPRAWQRVIDRLAREAPDLTCRAMRLPGSAEPLTAARRHVSLAAWRGAVDEEIRLLRRSHRAVWLVGHSMGGALAIDGALRAPDAVAGVVALAPLIAVSRLRSPLLPPEAWFGLARFFYALTPVFESAFPYRAESQDVAGQRYLRDRFLPFASYRALFRLVRENRPRAGELTCPLFLAVAGRDSVVDSAAALRWAAACPVPKKTLTLPDTPHTLLLEPGWESLADAFVAFVREHANRSHEGTTATKDS